MLCRLQGWPTRSGPSEQRFEEGNARPRSLPARQPEAPALGPQKGKRAHGAALTALRLPAPPARTPTTAAASARALARPNSKAPGAGEGDGGGEGREGRGGMQVLQLPPLPTAGRPGDAARGGKRAGANEFTFFFSPARSPSRFPPGPSSLHHRPGSSLLGQRSGRMEEAREEGEKGKVSRRAGRCAREQHLGP